ncbi:MAG: helix-turn-helix domain-containing protein, partial [Nitrososphaerota archaeon]
MFTKLLETIKLLGTTYEVLAEFRNNNGNIQTLYPLNSVGVSFTRLHQSLGVSSRTLSKYLKLCERNNLIAGYRFGKEVRYFITGKGRKFLYELINYVGESECMFSLHMLVGLAFFYPKARFIKHVVPIIKLDGKRRIRLRYYGPLAIDKLPEGKIFTIVMKLLKGLGYEVFPR